MVVDFRGMSIGIFATPDFLFPGFLDHARRAINRRGAHRAENEWEVSLCLLSSGSEVGENNRFGRFDAEFTAASQSAESSIRYQVAGRTTPSLSY